MSFATAIERDGLGVVVKLDVSLDNFLTIEYRYSTHAGIDATNDYDPRIVSLSPLSRGLGEDHFIQASTVEVVFDNTDEVADWLCDSANAVDVLKARMKLYVGVYDPATPSAIEWKQLGEFVFAEFPKRDEKTVTAVLADDALAFLQYPISTPTLQDWYDQDSSDTTNPLRTGNSFVWYTPPDTSLPLAFGEDEIECIPAGRYIADPSYEVSASPLDPVLLTVANGHRTWVVCATTDTSATIAGEIERVFVQFNNDGPVYLLPTSMNNPDPSSYTAIDVWTNHRSESVTKDGRTFRIIYIKLHWAGVQAWMKSVFGGFHDGAGAGGSNGDFEAFNTGEMYTEQIMRVWVLGYPLSLRNYDLTYDTSWGWLATTKPQLATDISRDIITYYSKGSASNIDTTSFARVRDQVGTIANAAGTINGRDGDPGRTLRDHLGAICASHDFDIFTKWDGTIAATARHLAYTASGLVSFDETELADFTDDIPSREQRGAPYNRVTFRGGRESKVFKIKANKGVYDSPGGQVTTWKRIIARELEQSWTAIGLARLSPWYYRNIDGAILKRIEFTTGLRGLLLELGDYFKVTWTRNLGDPYTQKIFQVEALEFDFRNHTVRVTALEDRATSDPTGEEIRGYILDNETYLTRATGSGGRTVTVTDSSPYAVFSSGSLISDGVEVGDHLILRDATEDTAEFKRNRALWITAVTSATQLTFSEGDLDFDAPGGTAVASWEIRRSHLTYQTAAGDPTNYPDGGAKYGRIASNSSATGVYSAAGPESVTTRSHKLFEG